jgi:hypothetical protein
MTSRVAGVESLTALTEMILFFPVRVRQRLRSRAGHKVRAKAIDATRRKLEAVATEAEGHRSVFNAGLYLLHLDQDLADFTDDLVCSISERRRTFVARQAAAQMHEAAESTPVLLGMPFRDAIRSLGPPGELQQRLDLALSDLNQFWQSQKAFLDPIRIAAAARRECDALGHIEALERVKPLEVMARGRELSKRLENLLGVVSEITMAPQTLE